MSEEEETVEYLFVLTFAVDGGGLGKELTHPIYGRNFEDARRKASTWLRHRKDISFVKLDKSDDLVVSASIVYPPTRAKNRNGLYLYVAEYFRDHRVFKIVIYEDTLDNAIVVMNQYYKKYGLGTNHKTIERNTTGIDIAGVYYPPHNKGVD